MIKVIAYGTGREGYFDLFMESCARHNICPDILGWGEKWLGSGKKLMAIHEYLKTQPENDIVLSVDPFDIIILSDLAEIEAKFMKMSAKFLCGALKLKGFIKSVYDIEFNRTQKPTPSRPTQYNFLNAGTWISTAGYAHQLLNGLSKKSILKENCIDQQILTGIYINERSVIDIDWKCEIFHNLLFENFITRKPDLKDLVFNSTRVINFTTGSKPCILHVSANTQMKDIALRLGYNPKKSVPVNDLRNYLRKAFFYLFLLIRYWIKPKQNICSN